MFKMKGEADFRGNFTFKTCFETKHSCLRPTKQRTVSRVKEHGIFGMFFVRPLIGSEMAPRSDRGCDQTGGS